MFDLGTLKIERIIVHEVPKRNPAVPGAGPILSDIESSLTPELRNYFAEKIRHSLLRAPFEVVFESTELPVPSLITNQFGGSPKSFVTASQELAQLLYAAQTQVNTLGLLVVVKGTIIGKPCLGILKLERQEGIRAQQDKVSGKNTFNLQHIRDLFLSDQTRVFKVGMFGWLGSKVEQMEAHVSDNQRGFVPRTEVADFFLRKFLGCELKQAPEVVTSQFLEVTQTFINEADFDSATKANYSIALNAELTNQVPTLSPSSFAQKAMTPAHKDLYMQRIQEHDLPQTFDKNTSLVAGRLRRLQLDFESGISLLAPADVLDDRVDLKKEDNGETTVSFRDRVKDIVPKR